MGRLFFACSLNMQTYLVFLKKNKKMNTNFIKKLQPLLVIGLIFFLNSCSNTTEKNDNETNDVVYPSDVISYFDEWNLILGDASNAGQANELEHDDFFT